MDTHSVNESADAKGVTGFSGVSESVIDELTGATYEKEHAMYVRYHALTHDEATQVLAETTHEARDEVFARIIENKYHQRNA